MIWINTNILSVKKPYRRVTSLSLCQSPSGENRPNQQQQPPLSIFMERGDSLCSTITFPACLRAFTERHTQMRKPQKWKEVRMGASGWNMHQRWQRFREGIRQWLSHDGTVCLRMCTKCSSGWQIQVERVEFLLELRVGVVTVWELLVHVEESFRCRNVQRIR